MSGMRTLRVETTDHYCSIERAPLYLLTQDSPFSYIREANRRLNV